MKVESYVPGTFCWVDLAAADAAAAKAFYGELFGWSAEDMPMGEGTSYTMLRLRDLDVAALYQMSPEQRQQGIPTHWHSYVSVASADDATRRAEELGGVALVPAFDVFDAGRMAVLRDPLGGAFSVWQPRSHIGSRLRSEAGAPCWHELATTDAEEAGRFYAELFGWECHAQDMGGVRYTSFLREGYPTGGMYEGDHDPPRWDAYFAVDDCDRGVERARAGGADVLMPPTDIPGVGRFATLRDPQGAAFSIIRLTM